MLKVQRSNFEDVFNEQSIYCYPDSDVLINNKGIKDPNVLASVERMISTYNLSRLHVEPIKGNFDIEHYLMIHQFLFGELYPFAGKLRMENMTKGATPFCRPEYIHFYLNSILNKMNLNIDKVTNEEELLDLLAYCFSEINIIHPFREGNGRAQREFFREFVNSKVKFGSYDLDYSLLDGRGKQSLMNGSIISAATGDICLLREFLKQSLVCKEKEHIHRR